MGEWTHGIFGCFSDIKLCILTYLAPCYTAGKIGQSLDEDGVLWTCLSLTPIINIFCLAKLRQKVRAKKGIEGTLLMDLVCNFCCTLCALHQEAAEVSAVDVDKMQSDLSSMLRE